MAGQFQSPKTSGLRKFFQAVAQPWVVLFAVVPGLVALNAAFVWLFPEEGVDPATMLNPFHPQNTMQAAYIYQNRKPTDIWGDFYFLMGSQLAARGQMIAANKMLKDAVEVKPDDPKIRLTRGIVLESLDLNAEAIAEYEKTVLLSPDTIDGYYQLGMLHDKLGNSEKSIEALRQALRLEPDNAMLNYDIGVLFAKKNDYANSAIYSRRAAESNRQFAEAFNNWAYALANLGKYAESLDAANHSLNLKPDSAATLDTRGYAYQGLKKYKEALADYDTALNLDGSIGEIYLHKGQVLERMNRLKEALAHYKRYLELAPSAPDKAEVQSIIDRLKSQVGDVESLPPITKGVADGEKPLSDRAAVPGKRLENNPLEAPGNQPVIPNTPNKQTLPGEELSQPGNEPGGEVIPE